jgi:hypothetical protein
MTFLEPLMLIGLPLVLLPIIIHLLNKLRHRSVKWAAMMFLLSANKTATRHAKIRQWLILLMRAFAIAAIIFVVSRPIAGVGLDGRFKGPGCDCGCFRPLAKYGGKVKWKIKTGNCYRTYF